MKVLSTITAMSIHMETENPLFGEGVFEVRIEDEGGGPFLILEQDENHVRITFEEFDTLVKVVKILSVESKKEGFK